MQKEIIEQIVAKQRAFFATGTTLSVDYRIEALKKLKETIIKNENKIADALKTDLGKSGFESYMCEIGLTLNDLSHMLKHIRSYAKEKTVLTPLAQFPSRSYKKPCPYGVTLIMSPWNYPFLLTMDPIVEALAAGNTVVLKPSNYSPATTKVLKELLESIFPEEYVAVITGGRQENGWLLEEKFDYIFFTGSKSVGQLVQEKASRHLTPVTLELGGKSPCIVDSTANLKLAARRIVFGKYLNCGQTCVAPDYILCHTQVKEEFLSYVKEEIKKQFGSNYLYNETYGKIISEKHFDRITSLISKDKVVMGGRSNRESLKIEPTVLDNVTWDNAVMKEEIFGPIMPVLTFETMDEVIRTVNAHDKPLALYIFSSDKAAINEVTSRCSYGGGCINDVVIHLATPYMGFGGVGESGMGSYHGKTGFDTFTHYKSIVDKKTWLDLPMRYQPYQKIYEKMLRFFLK